MAEFGLTGADDQGTCDTPPYTGWRPAAAERLLRVTGTTQRWFAQNPWPSRVLLAGLAALLIGLVLLLASQPARQEAARRGAASAFRSASPPDQPPPSVEPVVLLAVDPATARAMNAKVAFSTAPNIAARAYRTMLAGDDLLRAVDCLAAGVLYEAGDDASGQAAVAQVILNRARHPAFPHSVCGVVFQGSERTTGCQFTFACDGALTRIPRPEAWGRAQAVALAALTGSVYRDVGLATHYHTDWVVPYWSSSLDKIAELHTHLFFRWRGWWGTPPAFSSNPATEEPRIAKLAFLSDVHKDQSLLSALRLTAAVDAMSVRREGNFVLLQLPAAMAADDFPVMAAALCAKREHCTVVGWSDAGHVPATGQPDAAAMASAAFVYARDGAAMPSSRWNCAQFARSSAGECAIGPAPAPAVIASADSRTDPDVTLDTPPATVPSAAAAPVVVPIEPAPAPRKRRIDPCRALRNVDDRIGFCAGR